MYLQVIVNLIMWIDLFCAAAQFFGVLVGVTDRQIQLKTGKQIEKIRLSQISAMEDCGNTSLSENFKSCERVISIVVRIRHDANEVKIRIVHG